MKRIVVCPSCKIKMQIFDIGKEINQKCPRCQNSFDIHPVKPEGKSKNEGAKEQPNTESAPVTEAPQNEPAKVAATTAPTEVKETPKSEPPEVKEAPKSTEQPAEKKIMVKPPTPSALKTTPATGEKSVADKTNINGKSATDITDATEKSADTKPGDEVKQDNGKKPALESTKPTGFVKKPAAATKPIPTALPTSEPRVEPPLAGFSKMQFMILLVLLLTAIIIQVVFAKNQMKQISVINDNLKVIHSKL